MLSAHLTLLNGAVTPHTAGTADPMQTVFFIGRCDTSPKGRKSMRLHSVKLKIIIDFHKLKVVGLCKFCIFIVNGDSKSNRINH